MTNPAADTNVSEIFLTIKEAAKKLNLPYWKILRAVNDNLIPHYCFYNARKLVRISDIVEIMEKSRMDHSEGSNVIPLRSK